MISALLPLPFYDSEMEPGVGAEQSSAWGRGGPPPPLPLRGPLAGSTTVLGHLVDNCEIQEAGLDGDLA